MKSTLMLITFSMTVFTAASIRTVFAADLTADSYSTSLDFAQVVDVKAKRKSNGTWCFNTSVRHNDEGWDHYADGWEVLDLQGNTLGYRKLAHPHDNEQPFTRRLCNVVIPEGVSEVLVRAKCNTHGFGGKSLIIKL